MKEKPNYYAIIPAEVRYDEDLKPNAKLLYGEITALSNKNGYCYATNSYFADLYKVSKVSISNWISQLVEKGYISNEIVYKEGSKEIFNRYLKILKYPIKENFNTPIKENFKDNNTSINNTSIKKDDDDSIYDFLQNNGFILTPIHYEIISQWEDTELTRYAIKLAVLNGVYKINYVDKILYNFKKDGITTVAQAEAQKKEKPKYEKKMSFSEKMDMWIKELEEEENGVSGS